MPHHDLVPSVQMPFSDFIALLILTAAVWAIGYRYVKPSKLVEVSVAVFFLGWIWRGSFKSPVCGEVGCEAIVSRIFALFLSGFRWLHSLVCGEGGCIAMVTSMPLPDFVVVLILTAAVWAIGYKYVKPRMLVAVSAAVFFLGWIGIGSLKSHVCGEGGCKAMVTRIFTAAHVLD